MITPPRLTSLLKYFFGLSEQPEKEIIALKKTNNKATRNSVSEKADIFFIQESSADLVNLKFECLIGR